MKPGKMIRRIMIVSLWVAVGGGLLSLLLAANGKKKKGVCADYKVTVKGIENNYFISKSDVVQLLRSATKGNIKDEPMTDFNLQSLEALLEKNVWVSDAELWFDNKSVLHVSVEEREPVARIFTAESGSFYIDKELKRMPLSSNVSVRIPVFTGFPEKNKWSKKDSMLASDVRSLADFITKSDFWNAQIEQVHIVDNNKFELVPLVGNNIVSIGTADDLERKFERLYIFYDKVLSKTGFEKYSGIDVRYKGQVVATKRGTTKSPVDYRQLQWNVDRLLEESKKVNKGDGYIRPAPSSNAKKPVTNLVPPVTIPDDPQPESRVESTQNQAPGAVTPSRNDNK